MKRRLAERSFAFAWRRFVFRSPWRRLRRVVTGSRVSSAIGFAGQGKNEVNPVSDQGVSNMARKGPGNIVKFRFVTCSRLVVSMICGAAIVLIAGGSNARADEWNKRTILTVTKPIQVRNQLLEPGKYVLKVMNSLSDRFTVQIFNSTQTHLINTVFAIPTYRLSPADRSTFTFWETPPGTAQALRDWYYPGDTIGREFPYPKHPAVLTASLQAPTPPAMTAPEPEAAAAPAPAAAPETNEATQPTEMAETPAPAAPEAAQQPEPQPETPAPATAALPKTASPYPETGLAGLLLVGLYGLLRWRRVM